MNGFANAIRFIRTLTIAGLVMLASGASAQERARVIIETDAGGDPDDEQSLVRFLLYSNEWDVEGIIANRPKARDGENLNPVRDGLGIVRRHLEAYGAVYPRLKEHSPAFPTKEYLWQRTVPGYEESDAGVKLVIDAVDRGDPRPVWFMNWGTDNLSASSSLKRALDRVLKERGEAGYRRFKERVFLSSADKFGDHTFKIKPAFPLWVFTSMPELDGGRWYHRFGPITAKAGGFDLERDVRSGHGPLGMLYPTNTTIRQKEGDSCYFLYLIPTGMNDPLHPDWGSWAGRFGHRSDVQPPEANYYWANVRDTWQGSTHRDNTLKRWSEDLQNDFRARMDWCVKEFKDANHPPVPALNGEASGKIITRFAKPGDKLAFTAAGSKDPDGNALKYSWEVYPEAGTYVGAVELRERQGEVTSVMMPADAAGKNIHLILTVRDTGSPPLARYRRVIIQVGGQSKGNR